MACNIITPKHKTTNGQNFISALDSDQLYFFIGRIETWGGSDVAPSAAPTFSVDDEFTSWRKIYALKRITTDDISLVTKRFNWTSGTVYDRYDHDDTALYGGGDAGGPKDFYVLETTNDRVFKCLNNASGATSTNRPEGTESSGVFSGSSDSYKWIFLYDLTDAQIKFLTNDWLPVRELNSDDFTRQWTAQQTAVDGTVDIVDITAAGSGYTNGDYSVDVDALNSDGTGFAATATVSGGAVTAILVTAPGKDYTRLSISMPTAAGGSDATFAPIFSPKGGHASNAVRELQPPSLMIHVELQQDEGGTFSTANDFRFFGIIRNPQIIDSDTTSDTYNKPINATGESYSQTQDLTVTLTTPSTNFTKDEEVFVGADLANSTAKGRVVEWNNTTNILKLVDTYGSFAVDDTIKDNGGDGITATISSINSADLVPYSGDILYIENTNPITREPNQTEQINIIINF